MSNTDQLLRALAHNMGDEEYAKLADQNEKDRQKTVIELLYADFNKNMARAEKQAQNK